MEIAPMAPEDWPAVRRIYLDGLATGEASFATGVPDWMEWDAGHLPVARLTARLVAPTGGTVVGWAALSPVSRRDCYRGVAEVSVYVAPAAWGGGVGRALLETLARTSEDVGIWTLQASIFPENTASVRLHQRVGFRLVGRRERIAQHHGRWRDTLLLERRSLLVGTADQHAP